MNKVICDVCGTTYPETASSCPICGSAKDSDEQTLAGQEGEELTGSGNYVYVKGGRFSKKNVRKRDKHSKAKAAPAPAAPSKKETVKKEPTRNVAPSTAQRRSSDNSRTVQERNEPNNTGLVIVAILLIIAIVLVVAYILVKMPWGNNNGPDDGGKTTNPTTQQTEPPTDPTDDPVQIPCEKIQLSFVTLELNVGDTEVIVVQKTPEATTDKVEFKSSNPEVATVDTEGLITVVGEGEATILVTCGQQSATCVVKTPVKADPPEPEPTFEFEFKTSFVSSTGLPEVTMNTYGYKWTCYRTPLSVPVEDIIWTSDNTDVVTIEYGVVTVVGKGTTKIHAQYNGITYSCIVRCEGVVVPDVIGDCTISHVDVTLKVGESFKLKLRDKDGVTLEVTWVCTNDCVTIEGNTITGAVAGSCKVSTTYEGATYTCVIYVKNPQ